MCVICAVIEKQGKANLWSNQPNKRKAPTKDEARCEGERWKAKEVGEGMGGGRNTTNFFKFYKSQLN